MPECKKCEKGYPARIKIDGKVRNLKNRKYCLDCSPFGKHNTKTLEPISMVFEYSECSDCKKKYSYKRTRGDSKQRCNSCWQRKRQIKNKKELIKLSGGKCQVCYYDKCIAALQFHHLPHEDKSFTISGKYNLAFSKLLEECKKCLLLCANCHAEEHFFNKEKYSNKRFQYDDS